MQTRSFTELTVTEGFENNRNKYHSIVMGIDARYIPCYLVSTPDSRL